MAYAGGMSSRSEAARSWLLLGSLLGACAIGDLDLSGKGCPCVGGYVCDVPRNLCVPLGAADGGGVDATFGEAGPDSSPLPCPSPGTNLSNDPHNCGRCTHDCFGGACVSGICQPATVYEALSGPIYVLASDGSNLYWDTGNNNTRS